MKFAPASLMSAVILIALPCVLYAADEPKKPEVGKSPEVHEDGTITFRLLAAKAHDVFVNTDWDYKRTRLTAGADGVWSGTFGPIQPNVYSYQFIVDGVALPDPQNSEIKNSKPAMSLVEIGAGTSFCAQKEVPHGDIHIHLYHSNSLGIERRMYVYTPPGYDVNPGARFPVLYLLHGKGDDDSMWTRLGRANLILDNLLAEKKALPMIVVMPACHAHHSGVSETWAETFKAFGEDFLGDVVPFVEKRYRAIPDLDHRAIAGLSMGGMETMINGLKHTDQFAWLCAFSGVPSGAEAKSITENAESINKNLKLLWMGCGKSDFLWKANIEFEQLLQDRGIKHVWHPTEGFHHWPIWREYLNEILPQLFREEKSPEAK